jgi:hypothetical protein
MKKKFRPWKALKKGLVAAAAVGAGLVAGAEMLGGATSIHQVGAVVGISAAVTGIRAGLNWWKVNRDLADKTYVR